MVVFFYTEMLCTVETALIIEVGPAEEADKE